MMSMIADAFTRDIVVSRYVPSIRDAVLILFDPNSEAVITDDKLKHSQREK